MQKAACLAGLALHENRGDEMKIDKNRTLKLIAPFTLWAVGQHLLGATLSLFLSHWEQFYHFHLFPALNSHPIKIFLL